MKITNIKSLAILAAAAVATGCSENSWNDKLDGFEVPPVYSETQTVDYTLTAADYNTLAGLSANTALAVTEEEKAALKAIATNKCFASEEEARKYIPALFSDSSFPYFTLNNGSSIKVTYTVARGEDAEITAINSGVPEFKVTEEQYQAVWESDEDFINAFAPMKPASSFIPGILSDEYDDAVAGDYVVVSYNEATTNPIFGSVAGEEEPAWEMTDVLKNVAVGDNLSVRGVVTGISARGFVVTDKAGSICYDSGTNTFNDEAIKIGAEVNISGTVSVYSRCLQISKDVAYEVVGQQDYIYPAPVPYDGAMVDAACLETDDLLAQYISLSAVISVSGNYINLNIDGAEHTGSVYYAPDYVKSELVDGASVTLTGYFVCVSGSAKYFNILVTGIDGKNVLKTPRLKKQVGTVATVGKVAMYSFNGSKWVVPSKTVILQPEDYAAMNQTYGNLSGSLPASILPIYLDNNYPYAAAGDEMTVVYKYYNGSSTSYQAKKFVFEDGTWSEATYKEDINERFNRLDGKWMFDPSVTMTLPSGKGQATSALYYQACVNWVYENIDKPLGSSSITSGKGYVTSYGNNDYYCGASAYQNNVDLRASAARGQYPEGYEDKTDEEVVELLKYRFCYEVFPAALSTLHSDAVTIDGLEILYTFNFAAYSGSTDNYTMVYKVVGPAKFEFVSCTWWETGESELAKFFRNIGN